MIRQVISILMGVLGILTVLTGIGEAFRPWEEIPIHHIIVASLFIIAVCIHAWLNRKPLVRYFKGFGWNWVWFAGVIIAMIILVALII